MGAEAGLGANLSKMTRTPSGATPSAADSYPELLSLAAHECRTPLSVVNGYLRILKQDASAPLSDRQLKMVEEAEKSCARLTAIVAEMSDIAKLDRGEAGVGTMRFDLFALVEEIIPTVHEARDRDVFLSPRGLSAGAPLDGDRARIGAALAACCRAVLREQPAACRVVVDRRIVDDGPAPRAVMVIAREDEVDGAYAAQPGSFDERCGGLGLALPIARRVVDLHGGRVWSPANQPGDSATSARAILISLPLYFTSRHDRPAAI